MHYTVYIGELLQLIVFIVCMGLRHFHVCTYKQKTKECIVVTHKLIVELH